MNFTTAQVTIEGTTVMSQSRAHDEPWLEGESHDAYDKRNWRLKLNTDVIDGKPRVIIPAHGMQQAIVAAAKYSKRKITGKGNATWTGKFTSGIMLMGDPVLNVSPDDVGHVTISANADGVRGSGKRVPRKFPVIPPGWLATFEVSILDPIITEDIFTEMLSMAGMFIGVGRFRPEKGGTNGRFVIRSLVWNDARRLAA